MIRRLIYHIADVNAYFFSTRTRAFNNVWYWIAQVIGAGALGLFLDNTRFSRRTRLFIGWGFTFVLVNAIWGGGVAFVKETSREKKGPSKDIFDHNYTWYLIVCLSFIKYVFSSTLIFLFSYICYMASSTRSGRPTAIIPWAL
jgi:hypothetical protein